MKKRFLTITSFLLTFSMFLGACVGGGTEDSGNDTYKDYTSSTVMFEDYSLIDQKSYDESFDDTVYYRNDLKQDMGDPMVVYDEKSNLFYAYGTRGGDGTIEYFISTDLTNWTRGGVCMQLPKNSWAMGDKNPDKPNEGRTLWAPDVQYINGKYYMYFTVPMYSGAQIAVAVGDSLTKFELFSGTNADGEIIDYTRNTFSGMEGETILDQNVFQDDDGKLYMYFSYDTGKSKIAANQGKYAEIWGVQLKDPVTWDLSTITRIAVPGLKNLQDNYDRGLITWEYCSSSFQNGFRCSEGPYMIKKNGKYILTYVSNSFEDNQYNVGYALSDSPLSDFEKPYDPNDAMKNMLLGVPGEPGTAIESKYINFQTGTGHASIVKVGNEYMFAYHAHMNRDSWDVQNDWSNHGDYRALGLDYLYFGGDGTPYTNGPTFSLQRLPEKVSGLKNLAIEDGVRITTTLQSAANLGKLIDNKTSRIFDNSHDAKFRKGKTRIVVTLPKEYAIKAVNIYNSADYDTSIQYIDQIDFMNDNVVRDIYFNPNYIGERALTVGTEKYILPHTAFHVYLNDYVYTNKIVITIDADSEFTIGEIEILGGTI
ncbi:MAG TPA: hypothetical protein DHU65_05320 [Clostridiales bacterium]|nr:hypothetical protein [Clostridiales bacterium]